MVPQLRPPSPRPRRHGGRAAALAAFLASLLALTLALAGCTPAPQPADAGQQPVAQTSAQNGPVLDEDGWYYSKDEVSGYIQEYGHLPSNYITKKEARELGWSGGSVEKYAPGMAIGGDRFGNYEGLLPEAQGRTYTECDIDTNGKSSRGAKRIVFSNDGQIYYTEDHYESFELIAGEQ